MNLVARLFAMTALALCLSPGLALAESDCTDGIDNDGDLTIDCFDLSCDLQPCSDGVSCTEGEICSFTSTSCVLGVPNDALCDNSFYCDGDEVCNVVADCQPGTPVNCSGATLGCNVGFCNETTDSCDTQPDDLGCQNGMTCDGVEACAASGSCDPGPPVDCSYLAGTCATAYCDELASGCVTDPQNEGGVCDDGDPCSTDDTCVSGACTALGSMCGNGITEPACGEQCDPPGAESCTSMADLNSDGLFACEDPDCCGVFSSGCGATCKTTNTCLRLFPARGSMRLVSTGLDSLKLRGEIALPDPGIVNPIEDGFTIALSDADGLIYMATLQPGDLAERPRGPRTYVFSDKLAKVGQGVRDGLSKLRIQINDTIGIPTYQFKLKAFGDLSGANTPITTIHIFGVEDTATMKPAWKHTGKGWKLTQGVSSNAIYPPASCSGM